MNRMTITEKFRRLALPLAVAGLTVFAFLLFVGSMQAADLEFQDSSLFAYKYEMDIMPSDEDLDENGIPDFTCTTLGDGTATVSGGILTMNSNDVTGTASFSSIGPSSIWPGKFGNASYTIEMRMKAQAGTQTQPGGGQSLYVITPNNYSLGWFDIHETGQTFDPYQHYPLGGGDDNTDAFHDFRLAYDATENHFHIWRDGALIGDSLSPSTTWSGEDRLLFGDMSSGSNGTFDYDYVRFTAGAYVPVGGEQPTGQHPEYPGHIEGGPVTPGGTAPYAWYRADRDAVANDDGQVFYWGDQSGNDRHVSASGAPQLTNNGESGQATITFDGDGDYLDSPSDEWGEAAPGTVFAVWKRTGYGVEHQTPYVYDSAEDEQRQALGLDEESIGAVGTVYDGAFNNHVGSIADVVGPDQWAVTSVSYTTGSIDTICVNGKDVYVGNLLSGGMSGLRIGGYVLTYISRFWEGDIGELIVYEGELSSSERAAITEELMSRWNVEASFMPGDANNDGFVNELDAAILAENWLVQENASWFMGDFNGDHKVDDIDATLMATNWGSSSNAAVPEPGMLSLLLVGGLFALRISRKRSC